MSHTKGPWSFEQHNGNYEVWNNNTKIAIINQAHEVDAATRGPKDLANADAVKLNGLAWKAFDVIAKAKGE
jgi:hypothetical protein